MQIDIDFDVFKELTARRQYEGHSYNEVLRDLLGLKPTLGRAITDSFHKGLHAAEQKPFVLRDGELPSGTRLRAIYKRREYTSQIRDGRWIDENGEEHSSPSAAAKAVTQTNVNGLRFWHAMRPNDHDWRRLDILLASQA